MLPVSLILLSAVLHAAWNLAVRRHGDTLAASTLMVGGSVVLVLPLALTFGAADWRHALPWGVCAGIGEAAYFLTLARALEIGPLAAVYTISRGSSMLLIWPASHWLLGEHFGWRAIAAIALLVAGLVLLAPTDEKTVEKRRSRGDRGQTAPELEPKEGPGEGRLEAERSFSTVARRRSTTHAGYAWALACGVCIAAFQLIYKSAVAGGSGPPIIFLVSMATSLPVLVLSLGRGSSRALRSALGAHPGLVAFGAVSMSVSFLIVLYVLRTHGAGWVVTLRNCSVAFAQIFGWTILRERPTLRSATGVALVLADTLILGTG